MNYEQALTAFLVYHRSRRQGTCLERLKDGLGHAEELFLRKVWWPAFGHFKWLHPEFEVRDFKSVLRYIDFVYRRGELRVAIEIDGYRFHGQVGRREFSDQLLRQNHLVINGWLVLRFSYDDIEQRPEICQQIIQQLIGRWFADEGPLTKPVRMEREVVRLARRLGRPLTPKDVIDALGVSGNTARGLLRGLVDKQWFTAASGTKRIRSYQLAVEGYRVAQFW